MKHAIRSMVAAAIVLLGTMNVLALEEAAPKAAPVVAAMNPIQNPAGNIRDPADSMNNPAAMDTNPASNIFNPATRMDNPDPLSPPVPTPVMTEAVPAPLAAPQAAPQPPPKSQPVRAEAQRRYAYTTVGEYLRAAKKSFSRDDVRELRALTDDALWRIDVGTLKASAKSKQSLQKYNAVGYGRPEKR